jgi:hypothetical protein
LHMDVRGGCLLAMTQWRWGESDPYSSRQALLGIPIRTGLPAGGGSRGRTRLWGRIPDMQGKVQGTSPISGFSGRIRSEIPERFRCRSVKLPVIRNREFFRRTGNSFTRPGRGWVVQAAVSTPPISALLTTTPRRGGNAFFETQCPTRASSSPRLRQRNPWSSCWLRKAQSTIAIRSGVRSNTGRGMGIESPG